MTKQVNVATVVGTITLSGNALVTVTASGMNNSPKAIPVAVVLGNAAADVAYAARYALATDADVAAFFQVGGTGANIQLTARTDATNDTTMNIASANGSCTGLTAEPTSSTTVTGAALINNGYATLQNFKDYHNLTSTNLVDDGIVCLMIESASRRIDTETGRKFYSFTATKYFDMPRMSTNLLVFDDDCISVTSLTNGNGTAFATTDYVLYPYSGPPYDSIGLVDNPSMTWLPTIYGNRQQAIVLVGTFGYSAVPTDIQDACLMIVVQEYHRRYGEGSQNNSVVLPSGMVISMDKMPSLIAQIIAGHRKIGMA